MNMQTIQIMILLLDGFIKLAPWRTVTETMDRIGYAASESLARSISVAFAACTGNASLSGLAVMRENHTEMSASDNKVSFACQSSLPTAVTDIFHCPFSISHFPLPSRMDACRARF